MSADNGIYILKLSDEARAIYATAIDNLWWWFSRGGEDEEINPLEVYKHYRNAPTLTHSEVLAVADGMANKCPILEYGINLIATFNFTWNDLAEKAKEAAQVELEALNDRTRWDSRWDSSRKAYEKLLVELQV